MLWGVVNIITKKVQMNGQFRINVDQTDSSKWGNNNNINICYGPLVERFIRLSLRGNYYNGKRYFNNMGL